MRNVISVRRYRHSSFGIHTLKDSLQGCYGAFGEVGPVGENGKSTFADKEYKIKEKKGN